MKNLNKYSPIKNGKIYNIINNHTGKTFKDWNGEPLKFYYIEHAKRWIKTRIAIESV